ncbi:MAG: PilZ domain-containing protein [Deltaproteobacteria bacterium]|nr:PilZ domain-containing protein [Deltaproteobacteria bacterium]
MMNEIKLKIEDKERRCCKRVFYSAEDRMIGLFVFPGYKKKILEAHVMNISVGGLHFTIKRKEMISLKTGDRLILTKLMGNSPLRIVTDVETEIKWVLDYRLMKHVGFGCEFRNLPDMIRSQLYSFIESGWSSRNLPAQ